jgi:hypothetical protein
MDTNKEERDMSNTSCDVLANRFAEKAANGLKDVKFYLQSREEAGAEEVCHEVNLLYTTMEKGKPEPLDFGDFHWHEVHSPKG